MYLLFMLGMQPAAEPIALSKYDGVFYTCKIANLCILWRLVALAKTDESNHAAQLGLCMGTSW